MRKEFKKFKEEQEDTNSDAEIRFLAKKDSIINKYALSKTTTRFMRGCNIGSENRTLVASGGPSYF